MILSLHHNSDSFFLKTKMDEYIIAYEQLQEVKITKQRHFFFIFILILEIIACFFFFKINLNNIFLIFFESIILIQLFYYFEYLKGKYFDIEIKLIDGKIITFESDDSYLCDLYYIKSNLSKDKNSFNSI